jgi:uracil-DNA glycosylase
MEITEIINRNFTDITDKYRQFAMEKDACRKCSIYDEYKQVGQSEGNANNPTFMFIGEALGKDEVEQVRPFIGKAGQRLREEIRKHKNVFTKNNTLISNILSCRPKNNKFPRENTGHDYLVNKKVSNADFVVDFCANSWVRREINICKPKIVIVLGAVALEYITGAKGITDNRGKWTFLDNYRVWSIATFHPSYIMRCERMNDDHIVEQFEQDIAKIADTWHAVVSNDKRMVMSDEEWERGRCLDMVQQEFSFSFDASKELTD